jgi:hypothetical protein
MSDQLIISVFGSIIVPIVVAVLTLFIYKPRLKAEIQADLQKEYSVRFNEHKWQVYVEFIDLVRLLPKIVRGKIQETLTPDEEKTFNERFESLAAGILLTGTEELIKTYNEWIKVVISRGGKQGTQVSDDAMWQSLASVINAMHKDLGHETIRLTGQDVRDLVFMHISGQIPTD